MYIFYSTGPMFAKTNSQTDHSLVFLLLAGRFSLLISLARKHLDNEFFQIL